MQSVPRRVQPPIKGIESSPEDGTRKIDAQRRRPNRRRTTMQHLLPADGSEQAKWIELYFSSTAS